MAKKLTLHPYADKLAFERLMLLIATLVQYPGVGCSDEDSSGSTEAGHHDALLSVRDRLQEVAAATGIDLPPGYPATPTLRKDLETLRRYGILDQRMYRWGYYLGTGVMNREELQTAFYGLASAAKYQGSPQARRIYQTLSKRLRGLDLELKGQLFYPVLQNLNRAINYTDPDEMMAKGKNRDTLFHQLDAIEQAIVRGQAIEISRSSDFYGGGRVGVIQVWPLQLIYYNIAWYLIYEYCADGHLAVGRVNRFKDYCRFLTFPERGLAAQQQSLMKAHKLLENGCGLYLGKPEEQRAEIQGQLALETVKVRFFSPASAFILEGECRYPRQKINPGPKDKMTGEAAYVDYTVTLPPRSLQEFGRWIYRYMDKAQVLSPPDLVEMHRQAARNLSDRYGEEVTST